LSKHPEKEHQIRIPGGARNLEVKRLSANSRPKLSKETVRLSAQSLNDKLKKRMHKRARYLEGGRKLLFIWGAKRLNIDFSTSNNGLYLID